MIVIQAFVQHCIGQFGVYTADLSPGYNLPPENLLPGRTLPSDTNAALILPPDPVNWAHSHSHIFGADSFQDVC